LNKGIIPTEDDKKFACLEWREQKSKNIDAQPLIPVNFKNSEYWIRLLDLE
jgi:hypothetical protein